MRVLFSSTAAIGHVQPMLPLACALRDRGHDVVWATAEPSRARIEAAKVRTTSAGPTAWERKGEFDERWPEAASLRGEAVARFMFPRLFGAAGTPRMFADLMAFTDQWRPDLVVSEAAEFAAPIVARARGVPQATHGFGLVVPEERVVAASEACRPLWDEVGLEPRPYGGCYDELYIDIYPPSLQPDDLSRVGRIQHSRPESLTRVDGDELPMKAHEAINEGRPIVYLTFGTVFNINDTFAAAVAAAARVPEVLTVVTVGPIGDIDAFGAQPDHVHTARYIPQSDLFDHCAAVVSHAGSGTFLGALANGLPQVCLPQAADQFRNSAACADAGAGVALVGAEATVDAVEAAIRHVIADEHVRRNAEVLAAEIASMPGLDEVSAALEDLAG
jgi:UDP:flavonoid glycosyltransferase YjiC (YdhE family)